MPLASTMGVQFPYSRWEAVDDSHAEDAEVSFHEFSRSEELSEGRRHSGKLWTRSSKFLSICILVGCGWILGYFVRWAVHHFVVDPEGHCVTPIAFSYDVKMARWASEQLPSYRPHMELMRDGKGVNFEWSQYLDTHTTEDFEIRRANLIAAELVIKDRKTKAVIKSINTNLTNKFRGGLEGQIEGHLGYGHYGRYDDFVSLRHNFSHSIVLIRLNDEKSSKNSAGIEPAFALANAKRFGALAAIFFSHNIETIENLNLRICEIPNSVECEAALPTMLVELDDAKFLLNNFVNLEQVPDAMIVDLGGVEKGRRNESLSRAFVDIKGDEDSKENKVNVVGTINGKYEPTRYIVIAANRKDLLAHPLLLTIARTLNNVHQHTWAPGRTLMFVSLDDSEEGDSALSSWLWTHSTELKYRAAAVIHIRDGNLSKSIKASPVFRSLLKGTLAELGSGCRSCESLMNTSQIEPSLSSFQTYLGLSTMEVFLQDSNNDEMSKLLVHTIMELSSTPKLPLSASDLMHFVVDVMESNVEMIDRDVIDVEQLSDELRNSGNAFHEEFDVRFLALEFLGHHEFSDQLMELERIFLANNDDPHYNRHLLIGRDEDGIPVELPLLKAAQRRSKLDLGKRKEVQRAVVALKRAFHEAKDLLTNRLLSGR